MFVRGFDFGTPVQQIRAHCSIVGPVSSVEMQGEGAAVVSYPSPEQAEQAVQQLNNTTIPGNSRYIDVKLDDRGGRGGTKRPAQFTPTRGAAAVPDFGADELEATSCNAASPLRPINPRNQPYKPHRLCHRPYKPYKTL